MAVAHQSADLQIFERDDVILLQQRERGRVVEVAPLPLHVLLCAGQQVHRLATARAALRAATHAPVRSGELLFRCLALQVTATAPHR
jgi:hypothetical protein